MGCVFRALDLETGAMAALKALHAHRLNQSGRFEQEAIALARVDHPHIVQLLEFGYADDEAYLTMEFVEGGRTVADLFREEVDYDVIEKVMGQCAAALLHAHQRGFAHRDVKPRNILLQSRDDDPNFVRLVDFGLAKFFGSSQSTQFMSGTPTYMAPEQLIRKNIGPWTDWYGMGVIACQLLTGRKPLGHKSVVELSLLKRDPKQDPIEGLADLDLPRELRTFLRHALAFEPAQRISDAEQFSAELERAIAATQAVSFTPSIRTVKIPMDLGDTTVVQDFTVADFKASATPQDASDVIESILPSTRTNLPHRIGSFVGRRQEIGRVAEAVSSSSLVTLVGAPGVGKSRLAQRFGVEALVQFGGGAWYVDLSAITTPVGLAGALATALGITLPGLETIAEVGEALKAHGESLIIFDNMEHLVTDAAHIIEQWVDGAPLVRLLTTSRQRLGLAGETVIRLGAMTETESVSLFVGRLQRVDPEFMPGEAALEQVREIVRYLDYLPLPIEMAAARIPELSLGQILRRLSKRFAQLDSSEVATSPRKDTMWSAIDWSWHQLNELEKWVLLQCGLFRESFSLEAADAVVDAHPLVAHRTVHDVLWSLVEKSLVQGYRREGGRPRLSLLRSVREYIAHRLSDPKSLVDGMQRPVTGPRALAALSARFRHHFIGPDDKTGIMNFVRAPWVDTPEFDQDVENMRAAVESATQAGQYSLAARGWMMLWYGWHSFEGPFLTVAEGCRRLAKQPELEAGWRGWMHYLECLAWRSAGYGSSALAAANAGGALVAAEPKSILGTLLQTEHASIRAGLGDPKGILKTYRRALAIQEEAEEPVLTAMTLTRIGAAVLDTGDLQTAHSALKDALSIHREHGHRRYEAMTAATVARLQISLGKLDRAESWLEEALSAAGEVGDQRRVARYRVHSARLAFERGAAEIARDHVESAVRIHRRIGDTLGEVEAMTVSAVLDVHAGHVERADGRLRTALGKAELTQDVELECRVLGALGRLALDVGDLTLAVEALGEAVTRGADLSHSFLLRIRADMAATCARAGQLAKADDHLDMIDDAKKMPPHELGYIACRRVEVHRLAGRDAAALNALKVAHIIIESLALPDTAPLSVRARTLGRFGPALPQA